MTKMLFIILSIVLLMLVSNGCSNPEPGFQKAASPAAAAISATESPRSAAASSAAESTAAASTAGPRAVVPSAAEKGSFGSALTVGAHYYPWYSPRTHWNEGYIRSKLQPPQKPYLGEYDCGDPKVTEQQISWAREYGIDYFIMSWWGPGPGKIEDSNIRNGFLKSGNISDIKFGILYESPGRLGGLVNDTINFNKNSRNTLISDFEYLAENYFKHPSYLKYNGKPVVYFYLSRCFGGDYVNIIQELRKDIKDKFGMELFLIGDEIYWGKTYLSDEKLTTLDAFSIYNPHNNDSFAGAYPGKLDENSSIAQLYKDALENAQKGKSFFIPDAMPGFNDRGVRLNADHAAIPREIKKDEAGSESTFGEFLELAYKYRAPGLNTILVTSWNEWHEDSQIEPVKSGGTAVMPGELTEGFPYAAYGLKDLEILKAFKDKYSQQSITK